MSKKPDPLQLLARFEAACGRGHKGDTTQCPYCQKAFVKTDHKQIFCSYTGPGNCKNAYYTLMRSRSGVAAQQVYLQAKAKGQAPADTGAPAVYVHAFDSGMMEFLASVAARMSAGAEIAVWFCSSTENDLFVRIQETDEFGIYNHDAATPVHVADACELLQLSNKIKEVLYGLRK